MGNLASSMNRLSDDIVTTYNDRMAFMGSLKHNVDDTLKQFHNNRSRMSKDLNSSLSGFVRNLSDSTDKFLKDFRNTYGQMAKEQKDFLNENRNQRSNDVSKMMKMFQNEHQKMGKTLRNDLKSFSRELSSTVRSLRNEMSDDISGASKAWKNMESAMAIKRPGTEAKTIPKVEAEATKPILKKSKPKEQIIGARKKSKWK